MRERERERERERLKSGVLRKGKKIAENQTNMFRKKDSFSRINFIPEFLSIVTIWVSFLWNKIHTEGAILINEYDSFWYCLLFLIYIYIYI